MQNTIKNPYKILHIEERATDDEIKLAYQVLSSPKRETLNGYSPNVNLEELTWAATILLNPVEREKINKQLLIFNDEELDKTYKDLVNLLYPLDTDWTKKMELLQKFNNEKDYKRKTYRLRSLHNIVFRGRYTEILRYMNLDVAEYISAFDTSTYEEKKVLYTIANNLYVAIKSDKGRNSK